VALQLRKHGFRRVRPLLGGFYAWKKLGYPLIDVVAPATEASGPLSQIAERSI
jgi:rhodanese-related sulfurtransferase